MKKLMDMCFSHVSLVQSDMLFLPSSGTENRDQNLTINSSLVYNGIELIVGSDNMPGGNFSSFEMLKAVMIKISESMESVIEGSKGDFGGGRRQMFLPSALIFQQILRLGCWEEAVFLAGELIDSGEVGDPIVQEIEVRYLPLDFRATPHPNHALSSAITLLQCPRI